MALTEDHAVGDIGGFGGWSGAGWGAELRVNEDQIGFLADLDRSDAVIEAHRLRPAERAEAHGAQYLVSHTFDGPIARAVTAELALVLQTELAAGLGSHPALALWPPHRIAAIRDRQIVPHDAPGLGLHFDEYTDA